MLDCLTVRMKVLLHHPSPLKIDLTDMSVSTTERQMEMWADSS